MSWQETYPAYLSPNSITQPHSLLLRLLRIVPKNNLYNNVIINKLTGVLLLFSSSCLIEGPEEEEGHV